MKHFFTLSFCLVFPLLLYGQTNPPIAVFLGAVPDQGRIHDDIAWVLFVDDVLETDVAVGFISEPAAWVIEGRRVYMGYRDTIRISVPDSSVTAQYRIDKLEMGLARFAAKHKRMSGFIYEPKASTLSGFEQVKDPAKQWVFNLGANGSIDLDYFKDQNSPTGQIGRSNFSRGFNSRFSICRVLPRRRFTTDLNYSYQYRTVDFNGLTPRPFITPSGTYKNQNLGVNFSGAWGIGKRFALGTSLDYNGYISSFSIFHRNLLVAPGVEFNVFPYSRFFHEFLIVGYTSGLLIERVYWGYSTEIEFDHGLYLNGGIIRRWGYLNVRSDFSYSPLSSGGFAVVNSSNATLAFNLSKGLLFTLNANLGGSINNNFFKTPKVYIGSFSTSLGFHYYFGNNGLNIINPRFGRAFNRISI